MNNIVSQVLSHEGINMQMEQSPVRYQIGQCARVDTRRDLANTGGFGKRHGNWISSIISPPTRHTKLWDMMGRSPEQ